LRPEIKLVQGTGPCPDFAHTYSSLHFRPALRSTKSMNRPIHLENNSCAIITSATVRLILPATSQLHPSGGSFHIISRKINRHIEFVEHPLSRSKQSTARQINRHNSHKSGFPFSLFHFRILIATLLRIEIAATHSFKRRKHFLIATRNAILQQPNFRHPDRSFAPEMLLGRPSIRAFPTPHERNACVRRQLRRWDRDSSRVAVRVHHHRAHCLQLVAAVEVVVAAQVEAPLRRVAGWRRAPALRASAYSRGD
jgi:hypothetical protein